MYAHAICIWMHTKTRWKCWIIWSWSYRAAWCGCWNQAQVLLNIEQSLQSTPRALYIVHNCSAQLSIIFFFLSFFILFLSNKIVFLILVWLSRSKKVLVFFSALTGHGVIRQNPWDLETVVFKPLLYVCVFGPALRESLIRANVADSCSLLSWYHFFFLADTLNTFNLPQVWAFLLLLLLT